jgi:hypothetical protein
MTREVVLKEARHSLDLPFTVGRLPANVTCPIEGRDNQLRVIRAPKEKRLIIWDDSNNKRTVAVTLDDVSDLRDHLRFAVEYFSHIN